MTLEEIKELKDRVYELEGLLELAQLREDKIDELTPLILSRLNSLAPTVGYKSDESIEKTVEESYDTSIGGIFSQTNQPEVEPEDENAQKPLFCLNDRFRFRRTLFNGSENEFSEAMKRITLMDNYEEAKEYFLEEYGWNPEDEEVSAFMDIIKAYF